MSAKILIVDDDDSLEPIWAYIIKQADRNAHFSWAVSDLEAEAHLQNAQNDRHPYDLVIFDFFLPGKKTGLDLWSQYRQEIQGKIILVSGFEHQELMKQLGQNSVMPFYLKKPLVMRECIEAVSSMLSTSAS